MILFLTIMPVTAGKITIKTWKNPTGTEALSTSSWRFGSAGHRSPCRGECKRERGRGRGSKERSKERVKSEREHERAYERKKITVNWEKIKTNKNKYSNQNKTYLEIKKPSSIAGVHVCGKIWTPNATLVRNKEITVTCWVVRALKLVAVTSTSTTSRWSRAW